MTDNPTRCVHCGQLFYPLTPCPIAITGWHVAAKHDWTAKDGRSNSSDMFLYLTKEVSRLIRNSAFDLLSGDSESVGRLIMAQLAHLYRLVPETESELLSARKELKKYLTQADEESVVGGIRNLAQAYISYKEMYTELDRRFKDLQYCMDTFGDKPHHLFSSLLKIADSPEAKKQMTLAYNTVGRSKKRGKKTNNYRR